MMSDCNGSASCAALMWKALLLQRTRCETYQMWDTKFHALLSGALDTLDFQAALTKTILPAFQEVSTSLRQLQDGVVRGQFLHTWIERAQRLEQEHYNAAVQMAQIVAEHCAASPLTQSNQTSSSPTPTTTNTTTRSNASTAPTVSATTSTPTTTAGINAAVVSTNHAEDSSTTASCKGKREETENGENETNTVHPVSSEAPEETPVPLASLHDTARCALRHILPIPSQVKLTYVSCRDAWTMGSEEEERAALHERHRRDQKKPEKYGTEAGTMTSHIDDGGNDEDEDGSCVSITRASGESLGTYAPCEVYRRCAEFNAAVMPLWHANRKLRQQLLEWTEELQAELTDG